MEMMFLEILGLVGVTLVITHGSIFDDLREWLVAFEHPLNFLRLIGAMMICPQCSGFWVGVTWGLALQKPWAVVLMAGGLVSILSIVSAFVLQVSHVYVDRLSGAERSEVIQQLLEAREARKRALQEAQSKQAHGEPLNEEEAHALLDQEEAHADATVA
jgi:hypothetical protein